MNPKDAALILIFLAMLSTGVAFMIIIHRLFKE
jgi:hypothetical protein